MINFAFQPRMSVSTESVKLTGRGREVDALGDGFQGKELLMLFGVMVLMVSPLVRPDQECAEIVFRKSRKRRVLYTSC